jgi:dextranase
LHRLIVQAQDLGHGKPVVLAAYINPQHIHNVLLTDAVIFASGGGHIELGEANALLADAYFPRYGPVSEELSHALKRYYDFTVRYQDVVGPRTEDATLDFTGKIEVRTLGTGEVVNTAANAVKNKVWPIVRSGEGSTAISLVNLLGLDAPDWKEPLSSSPNPLAAAEVRIDGVEQDALRIWFATPDNEDLSTQQLNFKQDNGVLTFEIPSLVYWDLIVIEWDH